MPSSPGRYVAGITSTADLAMEGIERPGPSAPREAKERWVHAKYVQRRMVEGATSEGLGPRLWVAVRESNVQEVMRLLVKGADVTSLVAEGFTVSVLHLASQVGDLAVVELLLQHNADMSAVDGQSRTPLHYAVLHEKNEVAKVLLRRGANARARDCNGKTALDCAMETGRIADDELFVLLADATS
eukprot:CAMPEP_0182869316 /NCGR_PEP_ID=MMETSP0034_2-20130328/9860_1 /TAXON_ID=156128 /ORGANISM="Nephroselmis pyriformis, Strain CCMP717" /LENGTH=185 /DNA_ID=CAMNT_0025001767 /DNA_START=45 /DNA_END=602 /DNA_ORIENTATION=-